MKLSARVLHKKSRAVQFKWPWQNRLLAESMHNFMRTQNGIGLAAPQIGISKRLFVMEVSGTKWNCFNPEIVESALTLVDWDEGCLSFPGDRCIIKRPLWVGVRYQDHEGSWKEETLDGLAARCFQHELDHLDGITMWDRKKEQNAEQS
jgi:peptide deformylase